jgi:hypothetical protein
MATEDQRTLIQYLEASRITLELANLIGPQFVREVIKTIHLHGNYDNRKDRTWANCWASVLLAATEVLNSKSEKAQYWCSENQK